MPRLHAARFRPFQSRQGGVTLIELVISIVIISIGAAAILGVYTNVISASADPMKRAQAIAVAEMYLDEIYSRPFAGTTGDGSCGSRHDWDHIDAYDGLSCSPEDVFGNDLAGLGGLTVNITVTNDGSLGAPTDERRIDVTVTDSAGRLNITISGWRAQ